MFNVIGYENSSWLSIIKFQDRTGNAITLAEYKTIEPDFFDDCNLRKISINFKGFTYS